MRREFRCLLLAIAAIGGPRMLSAAPCQQFVFDPPIGSLLPPGTVGTEYFEQIKVVSGATPPVSASPSPSAPPPPGLSVFPTSNDPSAVDISGVPTTAAAGVRTFIINFSDSLGCTSQVDYAINISAGTSCNPPITLLPPGGSLEPRESGHYSPADVIIPEGITPPVQVQTSGLPGQSHANVDDPGAGELVIIATDPDLAPGTYTFQVTVIDARGCKATGTYSFTVVGPDAGCVIQLNAPEVVTARTGSTITEAFTATNIGDAPCIGPFSLTTGPGLPQLSTISGGAFPIVGTSGATGQQFGNGGTIPAGGFVGVATSLVLTTPGVIQVPFTLQTITGPTSTNTLTGNIVLDTKSPRLSNRNLLTGKLDDAVRGRHRISPDPVAEAAPDETPPR